MNTCNDGELNRYLDIPNTNYQVITLSTSLATYLPFVSRTFPPPFPFFPLFKYVPDRTNITITITQAPTPTTTTTMTMKTKIDTKLKKEMKCFSFEH